MSDQTPSSSLAALPTPALLPTSVPHIPLASATVTAHAASSSSSAAAFVGSLGLVSSPTPRAAAVTATLLEETEADGETSPPLSASKEKRTRSEEAEEEGKADDDLSPSKRPCAPVFCLTCGEQNNASRIRCWRAGCGQIIRVAAPDEPTAAPAPPLLRRAWLSAPAAAAAPGEPLLSPSPSSDMSSASSSQQSFHVRGNYLPTAPDAVEALRKGEFMTIRHYLPHRLTYANLNQTSKITLEVVDGGGVRARTTNTPRHVNTYEELEEAHRVGILELLHQFGDAHRQRQYNMLWDSVRHFKQELKFSDADIIWYYEMYRHKHPKLTDCVGQHDPDIERQLTMQLQAKLNVTLAAKHAGSGSFSSQSSSSASRANDPTHSRRHNVCIKYNNLECTTSPCPRGFQHICCRCFGEHAADSGECTLPDPRKQPGFKSRASRGGAGGRA